MAFKKKYKHEVFRPEIFQDDIDQVVKLRRSLVDKNNPVNIAIQKEKLGWFWVAMRGLPYKYQMVLSLRFGLLGRPRTLQSIRKYFGDVTGSRVNQIEQQALLKLLFNLKCSNPDFYQEYSGEEGVDQKNLFLRIHELHFENRRRLIK